MRQDSEDEEYIASFAEGLRALYPGCPANEAVAIAQHACRKHSGRVGRSAAAKQFDREAIRLAVVARIRHQHTDYDEILMQTGHRDFARERVRGRIEEVLARWKQKTSAKRA